MFNAILLEKGEKAPIAKVTSLDDAQLAEGEDSVMAPTALRETAWRRLANLVAANQLDAIAKTIGLAEALAVAPDLLDGKVRGRLVVDVAR